MMNRQLNAYIGLMGLLRFIYLLVSFGCAVSGTQRAKKPFEICVPSQIVFYGDLSNGLGHSFDQFSIVKGFLCTLVIALGCAILVFLLFFVVVDAFFKSNSLRFV